MWNRQREADEARRKLAETDGERPESEDLDLISVSAK